jgi:hypothetical protein
MRNRLPLAKAVMAALSIAAPLFAHHGGATLYTDRTITLKGTVKTWYWSNPHCLLTITVKGDDGKTVNWITELQAPNTIHPLGFRKDSFNPGDEVTATLQPTRNGSPTGRLLRLMLADGTVLNAEGFRGAGRGDAGAAQ